MLKLDTFSPSLPKPKNLRWVMDTFFIPLNLIIYPPSSPHLIMVTFLAKIEGHKYFCGQKIFKYCVPNCIITNE